MTQALSTKTYVLILIDGSRFFLEAEEGEAAKAAIKSSAKYIEIGDSLIMVSSISRVISGGEYEEAEKIKRGEWKCDYGFWHERNNQCGHGLL